MEAGAPLPQDDRSRGDDLAIVALHTEALALAIATVLGRADAFFMRHLHSPSCRKPGPLLGNGLHHEASHRLPVTERTPVADLVFVLHEQNAGRSAVLRDACSHQCSSHRWGADRYIGPIEEHEDFFECDPIADVTLEARDLHLFAFSEAQLTAVGANYRFHEMGSRLISGQTFSLGSLY
jgi:hypothetical protein